MDVSNCSYLHNIGAKVQGVELVEDFKWEELIKIRR